MFYESGTRLRVLVAQVLNQAPSSIDDSDLTLEDALVALQRPGLFWFRPDEALPEAIAGPLDAGVAWPGVVIGAWRGAAYRPPYRWWRTTDVLRTTELAENLDCHVVMAAVWVETSDAT